LTISDTGVGITAEIQARLFEPFFTTKDVGKGSGLGLPQVYGFAQQSSGRASIDSTVGAGTTVTVLLPRSSRLPAVPASDDASDIAPAGDERERRGHVLLVEDDKEVSALTREMLASLGFSVTHAASPKPRLARLPTTGPSTSCCPTS
jgi:hypothetical protein